MSFSFSRFLVRPASFAEHASIKEKMRKHLRKSAFVSDEQAITLRGKKGRRMLRQLSHRQDYPAEFVRLMK